MRPYVFILAVLLLAGCGISEKENEQLLGEKSKKIATYMEQEGFKLFEGWNVNPHRGVWMWERRNTTDSTMKYLCFYDNNNWERGGGVCRIAVYDVMAFTTDFVTSFSPDTLHYQDYSFIETSEGITITAGPKDGYGKDDTLVLNEPANKIFTGVNPFRKFEAMDRARNDASITSVFHRYNGTVELHLGYQHTLTYNPHSKPEQGNIAPHWHLEKLEKPVDYD